MADVLGNNPYRRDRIAEALFVGREELLGELVGSIRAGRNMIRAVMGGRGMGKSSLAKQLAKRLDGEARTVVVAGDPPRVIARVGEALGVDLVAGDTVRTLVAAVKQVTEHRVVLVLDEIEKILDHPQGIGLLDNLREAYESAEDRLALIVLGGTRVHGLLRDSASPFLRIAGRVSVLTGLSRNETARLLRDPLSITFTDDLIDALWAETAGHPLLLQSIMEECVQRARSQDEVPMHLAAALREIERQQLHPMVFPIWWDNLGIRGQQAYHALVQEAALVPRARWVACLGNDPRPSLDALASTGVAIVDDTEALARGVLFRRWVEENHPRESPPVASPDPLDGWLNLFPANPFERQILHAFARWARATVEFPAAAVRTGADAKNGNPGLQPEAFFQMHCLVALLQHPEHWTAEPEALSMKVAGRSDIKLRALGDLTQRACAEFKIFGRKDETVVQQVLGYAAPEDSFAVVVSIDRHRRPLLPEYEARCFDGAVFSERHPSPAGLRYPSLLTIHDRPGSSALRVWHFLLQLRDA